MREKEGDGERVPKTAPHPPPFVPKPHNHTSTFIALPLPPALYISSLLPKTNTNLFSSLFRERNINFFVAPVERGTQFITPPVERTVKRIEAKLPLEKAALNVDRRIKRGIDRAGGLSSSAAKKQ